MNKSEMRGALQSIRPQKCSKCEGTGENHSVPNMKCWVCNGRGYIQPDITVVVEVITQVLLELL